MLVKSLKIQYGDVKQLYENNNFKIYKSFNEQLANFFITKTFLKYETHNSKYIAPSFNIIIAHSQKVFRTF